MTIDSDIEVQKLRNFHTQHFSDQNIPDIQSDYVSSTAGGDDQLVNDDLGYYLDGVKRTLTDEQVAMFRNSEIQRLLAQRRRQREQEEEKRQAEQENNERKSQSELVSEREKKPRFADDIAEEVQSLVYDDAAPPIGQTKQFVWPKLG